MSKKNKLSILEFSRLTGIKRDNLRFYDRIGLLCPETRGDNNYRYYSRHQLNTAYLVSSLRWIGVGIDDIKLFSAQRTPQKALELFAHQEEHIQAEIERLQEIRRIMEIHSEMIREALAYNGDTLFLQEKSDEPIFLCPTIPDYLSSDEGEKFSYDYAEKHGINLGYPLGAKLTQGCLEAGDTATVLQYYFKAKAHSNALKPAGLYAVAYGKCDPWHSEPLYHKLLEYVRAQGLSIAGDAYEEYPLSDISIQTPDCQGVRVEIPVHR